VTFQVGDWFTGCYSTPPFREGNNLWQVVAVKNEGGDEFVRAHPEGYWLYTGNLVKVKNEKEEDAQKRVAQLRGDIRWGT
jgi:hypothetical protein